jgi:hypothetical protein
MYILRRRKRQDPNKTLGSYFLNRAQFQKMESVAVVDKNPLAFRPAASQPSDSAVMGPTGQARLRLTADPWRLCRYSTHFTAANLQLLEKLWNYIYLKLMPMKMGQWL